jgi:CRP-like cAMP-binding protein
MPLSGRIRNALLASLSVADLERLRPNLRAAGLKYEDILIRAGDPVVRVYFPHSGIISLVVRMKSGATVEAATVGHDGAFGSAYAFSGHASLCTAVVQMEGEASTIDVGSLRMAAAQSQSLLATLFRFDHVVHAQALQSAACNALHSVEARLSRWLLRARDLAGSDRLTFSQDYLAQMLGTHRNTVSIVAHSLQQTGVIHYSRGVIDIVDLAGLANSSCECYDAIKAVSGDGRRDKGV